MSPTDPFHINTAYVFFQMCLISPMKHCVKHKLDQIRFYPRSSPKMLFVNIQSLLSIVWNAGTGAGGETWSKNSRKRWVVIKDTKVRRNLNLLTSSWLLSNTPLSESCYKDKWLSHRTDFKLIRLIKNTHQKHQHILTTSVKSWKF